MSEGDLDKSDPASPYKLEKAREKGSVAKSQDVAFLAILFGMTCMVFGMGTEMTRRLVSVLQATLAQVGRNQWDTAYFGTLVDHAFSETLWILAPVFAMLMVLAILMGIWQVGFTISVEPLKPDFQRINPTEGFKRLFSMRSTYDLVRSTLKLAIVLLVLAAASGPVLGELIQLMQKNPDGILRYLIQKTGTILALLTAVMLVLSIADVAYTRWEFLKKMRMSKREIKDEYKQREGDPRIKSRLRELRLEWLKKGMSTKRVADADVLITNPTHYAVAVSYKREAMPAPRIVAKGSGDIALKMREVAARHHIPIVCNPPLARSLYRLAEPDDFLPEQHYTEVARILVWVLAARAAQPRQHHRRSAVNR